MGQLSLPLSMDSLIPNNHLVRVVNEMIERMNIEPLLKQYKGGGTSSYHPKMMLKVLVYAYTQKLFSSRQIARALQENINFIWIAAGNKPDFRTINNFRGSVLKPVINEVFTTVLEMLITQGYIRMEHYFLDGTKIEANANRYSFVWGKAIKKNKAKLEGKIRELLQQIDEAQTAEDKKYGEEDIDGQRKEGPVDIAAIEAKVKELDAKLAKDPPEKKSQLRRLTKVNRTLKEYLDRLQKYTVQEKKLKGRNSYSKTDEDATFMRMKEDHMKNGQLKPGYNIQIGTEGQFIVGFSVHQNRSDTGCLIPNLEQLKQNLGRLPKQVIADAGYGSEENYEYLAKEGIPAYVKYNNFHREQKKAFKKAIFRVENLPYDREKDEYICPAGKRLRYRYDIGRTTDNGYRSKRRIYECEDCTGCDLRSQCTRSEGNRRIEVGFRLNELKQAAKERLMSDEGKKLRSQRAIEDETVFGRIKQDWSFRRFLLRGLEKVKTEWGLLSIAHNMAKKLAVDMKMA